MKQLVVILVIGVLSACGAKQEVRIANDYIKRSPKSHAKPGAAISLSYAQVNLDIPGVQYEVDPSLFSGYDGEELTLSVNASDGLYIVDGDTSASITLNRGTLSYPLTVIATENGRYYLYIIAKVSNGESRALTFIVQVGDELESTVTRKVSSGGESLVPLAAKEEIIQH